MTQCQAQTLSLTLKPWEFQDCFSCQLGLAADGTQSQTAYLSVNAYMPMFLTG